MFDKENKGYIKATQVGQILRTMGQAFEERDLKQLIKEFDSDGKITFHFKLLAVSKNALQLQLVKDEGRGDRRRRRADGGWRGNDNN